MTAAQQFTAKVKVRFAERFRELAGSDALEARGYIVDPIDAAIPNSPDAILAAAGTQFVRSVPAPCADLALKQIGEGAGGELAWRGARPPKFLAAHSSSALAANTLAPFLVTSGTLRLAGSGGFTAVTLEARLRIIGVGGEPPNLDALAASSSSVVAVESKCTEHLTPKTSAAGGDFAMLAERKAEAGKPEPYGQAMEALGADPTWVAEYAALRADPLRFRFLGATQLIKHYLGVKSLPGTRAATLLYLYWQPTNWREFDDARAHRTEVDQFTAAVHDPTVQFRAMSYQELWAAWQTERPDPTGHVTSLRSRYELSV